MANLIQWYGTGRRKEASARVFVRPGNGRFLVNKRELDAYFERPSHRTLLRRPLDVAGVAEEVDVIVTVRGGGKTGQAGAIRLGLARALAERNAEHRSALKAEGLLTRDARVVERKKYGQPKARKRFQFSKR